MAQTIMTQVKSFCTTANNAPHKALSLVLASMDHMIQHGDWDALAYFIGHGPRNYSTIARAIVGQCLGGVELDTSSKKAKAHKCRAIFIKGDNFGATERMSELRRLVAANERITSKAVREVFCAPPAEWSADAAAKRMAAKLKAEGVNVELFVTMLREAA